MKRSSNPVLSCFFSDSNAGWSPFSDAFELVESTFAFEPGFPNRLSKFGSEPKSVDTGLVASNGSPTLESDCVDLNKLSKSDPPGAVVGGFAVGGGPK